MSMRVRLLEWMCRCYKRFLSYDTPLTDNFQALSHRSQARSKDWTHIWTERRTSSRNSIKESQISWWKRSSLSCHGNCYKGRIVKFSNGDYGRKKLLFCINYMSNVTNCSTALFGLLVIFRRLRNSATIYKNIWLTDQSKDNLVSFSLINTSNMQWFKMLGKGPTVHDKNLWFPCRITGKWLPMDNMKDICLGILAKSLVLHLKKLTFRKCSKLHLDLTQM